ncbi:putative lipase YDL109C [Monosporozyma servazzii]
MLRGKQDDGKLLFNENRQHKIGGMSRFKITIDRDQFIKQGLLSSKDDCIHLRIKNEESPMLRGIWLTGPYSYYCDVRPINYNENIKYDGDEPIEFCENLKPDSAFKATLRFTKGSQVDGEESKYCWIVDILSQLAVVTFPSLKFSIRLGTSRRVIKSKKSKQVKLTIVDETCLRVEEWDETSLWNLPPKYGNTKPVHLVMITHGIFSNIGCDMLYMKDKIEEVSNAVDESINGNVIVRGYSGNMGKSEKGVHYLGKRVGDYILQLVDELVQGGEKGGYDIDKISFIGHSLGGPTQSMAVHYITVKRPTFFDKVKPINFITLASPYLGVIGDFPFYLSVPLDIGFLGLTGRDLNLKYTPFQSKDGIYMEEENETFPRLIMEIIPHSPVKRTFEMFVCRTLYANVINDGIVPLRTAALLYLDWKGISNIDKVKHEESVESENEMRDRESSQINEIPREDEMDVKTSERIHFIRGVRRKNKKFGRGQVVSEGGDDNSNNKFTSAPDEASAVKSALSTLTAPIPTQEYIKDPETRTDIIIHDRMYKPDQLPPRHYEDRPLYKKLVYPNENINRIQERIAWEWQSSMDWRKVLVRIQPDSHNNIVVRRRFTNLYGNVAISHMAEQHFNSDACMKI